jgi:hypothetical protein
MRTVLILLVALTMACGAAAFVTVSFASVQTDDVARGY